MKGTKKFIAGFVIGATLFGSVGAMAAGGSMIEIFHNIKDIKIDRVSKMPADTKPFTYNGSTYVPLRFISEALGEDVKWDGASQTVHIGETDGGSVTYLGDSKMSYLTYQESDSDFYARGVYNNKLDLGSSSSSNYRIKDVLGKEYTNYLYIGSSKYSDFGDFAYVEYPLNGQYERFLSDISLDADSKLSSDNFIVEVFADDKLVYSEEISAGMLPEKIEVNVNNANKLKIQLVVNTETSYTVDYTTVLFGNPRLTK
ncbi:stalk domain-containing protein [Mangrovibacillus cuniculi]|uniref:Copper amine oxidase-like N-terminal domain-containing protein n=1 Tax=Mangrovibacillus cuniculi TaxID=2593652 RepID=A0A7S8HG91_9BACI|nr:stalk domain-containing protein [Mangrovibacillus cuniculi]QPC47542.1 hypothetical protein G8O30_11570 [Mangrovibacillus cuniculi]